VCVCVCVAIVFCFRFAWKGIVVLLSWFVGVLWFLLRVVVCSFGLCWLSSGQGVARFFVLGCFVACPFVSVFSLCCVRWSWVVMDALFLFWSASCCPGYSRLDWPCVLWFHIYAAADARWCARRLAYRTLVPFCSFKVVVIFCGSCFGALCVVVCWMCGGSSWLVGGGDQRVGFLFFCVFL